MHIKSLNQFSSLALRRGWKERHSNWRLEKKADYWDGQKKATSLTSQKCSSVLLVSRNHEADWIFTLGVALYMWVFPTYDGFIITIKYKVLKGEKFTSSFSPHAANASLIMLEFLRLRKLFKSYGGLKKHWTNLSQWQLTQRKGSFFISQLL